ncbi:hypothetical protein M6B38_346130 [Iris pallida]|uniref:Uncharacterized protein n=1 Tax=Iris pallida TaxID=29817 RepID=A0AAX6GVM8_IRIPA|nr:hypothetical protein M6B38_346130 [Iris pallida]
MTPRGLLFLGTASLLPAGRGREVPLPRPSRYPATQPRSLLRRRGLRPVLRFPCVHGRLPPGGAVPPGLPLRDSPLAAGLLVVPSHKSAGHQSLFGLPSSEVAAPVRWSPTSIAPRRLWRGYRRGIPPARPPTLSTRSFPRERHLPRAYCPPPSRSSLCTSNSNLNSIYTLPLRLALIGADPLAIAWESAIRTPF